MAEKYAGKFSELAKPYSWAVPGMSEALSAYFTTGATGNTDFTMPYSSGASATVPTGKKFMCISVRLYNSTGGSIIYYQELKRSSTYYRLAANQSVSSGASANISNGVIYEAGDTISVNAATTAGGIYIVTGKLIDASTQVSSNITLSLASGDNTIFTAPAIGETHLLDSNWDDTNFPVGVYINSSGGQRSIYSIYIPNGGTSKQLIAAAAVNDAALSFPAYPSVIEPGGAIGINTNAATATQIFLINTYVS